MPESVICENYKTCFHKDVCPHSKRHEFTYNTIVGYIANCQGKTDMCNCKSDIEFIKELRKEKLKLLKEICQNM